MRPAFLLLVAGAGCALACGAKSGLEPVDFEPLEVLPDCLVEGETRACQSICGMGEETCIDGQWVECDAQKPKPPRLDAVVRDFRDEHPDFEQPSGGSILDLGIVEFELGADDKPVYAGNPNTRTTTGKREFDEWYRDTDSNTRLTTDIQLSPSPEDPLLFVYENSAFFPIDGQGFGNEGRGHNYHFTVEVSTAFRYIGGEVFEFTGDDDLWVFINRRLAIDIGGRHAKLSGSVSLDEAADELQLEKGEIYPLHLFFAERHTVASNFNIKTTIAEFEFCE